MAQQPVRVAVTAALPDQDGTYSVLASKQARVWSADSTRQSARLS